MNFDCNLGLFIFLTATSCLVSLEFKHLGCFEDAVPPQAPDLPVVKSGVHNPETCAQLCSKEGFAHSAIKAGTTCLCGDDYGIYGTSRDCNYTCGGYPCGGVHANDVYYSIDSDPVTRSNREHEVVTGGALAYHEARRQCVKKDGDLVVVGYSFELKRLTQLLADTNLGIYTEVWVGLRKRTTSSTEYKWTDPTSFGLKPTAVEWDTDETYAHNCVTVEVATMTWHTRPCTRALPYICKATPTATHVAPNGASGTDSGANSPTVAPKKSTVNSALFYTILVIFILLYGGSCIFYCIGKSLKYFSRQQRKAQLMEMIRDDYEPNTGPGGRSIVTPRNVKINYPPPPYSKSPAQYTKDGIEMKRTPLYVGYRGPGSEKKYRHELEDEVHAADTEEDSTIDFSKLSIQDIIYIKNLLGERRPGSAAKKKKIIIS